MAKVLYDPSYSERGVLLAAARVPRAPNPLDFEVHLRIEILASVAPAPLLLLLLRSLLLVLSQHAAAAKESAGKCAAPPAAMIIAWLRSVCSWLQCETSCKLHP